MFVCIIKKFKKKLNETAKIMTASKHSLQLFITDSSRVINELSSEKVNCLESEKNILSYHHQLDRK